MLLLVSCHLVALLVRKLSDDEPVTARWVIPLFYEDVLIHFCSVSCFFSWRLFSWLRTFNISWCFCRVIWQMQSPRCPLTFHFANPDTTLVTSASQCFDSAASLVIVSSRTQQQSRTRTGGVTTSEWAETLCNPAEKLFVWILGLSLSL